MYYCNYNIKIYTNQIRDFKFHDVIEDRALL
jgi:hypothetical protein